MLNRCLLIVPTAKVYQLLRKRKQWNEIVRVELWPWHSSYLSAVQVATEMVQVQRCYRFR